MILSGFVNLRVTKSLVHVCTRRFDETFTKGWQGSCTHSHTAPSWLQPHFFFQQSELSEHGREPDLGGGSGDASGSGIDQEHLPTSRSNAWLCVA